MCLYERCRRWCFRVYKIAVFWRVSVELGDCLELGSVDIVPTSVELGMKWALAMK